MRTLPSLVKYSCKYLRAAVVFYFAHEVNGAVTGPVTRNKKKKSNKPLADVTIDVALLRPGVVAPHGEAFRKARKQAAMKNKRAGEEFSKDEVAANPGAAPSAAAEGEPLVTADPGDPEKCGTCGAPFKFTDLSVWCRNMHHENSRLMHKACCHPTAFDEHVGEESFAQWVCRRCRDKAKEK